ncbi:MAG: AraC family transcriptional regulator, partial [Lachnospiraceae bacterium]|nr:AraC family transcriptional regulator [Lachnospiraceae bacterium]
KQFLSCYYIGHVPEPEKQENSIAERILAVMRREFTRDITQADVAGELGMSASYFSTLFKKELGSSFTDMLNAMRIDRAVALIESGETDVDQIAQSCGFTNRKYFLQIFRKRMKKTVGEYMEARKK